MPDYTIAPASLQGIDPNDVLHDISSTGRENPWAELKQQAEMMSTAITLVDERAGQRMALCAETLFFRRHAEGQKLTLDSARFCRARLCPVCQWRRSLKYAGQAFQILQWLAADRINNHCKPYAWIMLTFTQANVPGSELASCLDSMQRAWHDLSRRGEWKQAIRGAMRSLEVTYNAERDDYHPHLHILAAVLPSYFASRYYIPQARWRELWRDAMGLSYLPQVEAHKVTMRGRENEQAALWAAIAETMKYTCKVRNMLDPSDVDRTVRVVGDLYRAAKGRRFAGFTGVVRDARRALALDDVEEGNLVHVDGEEKTEAAGSLISWGWYTGPRLYLRRKDGAQ